MNTTEKGPYANRFIHSYLIIRYLSKKKWSLSQSYVPSSTGLSFRINLRPTGNATKASSGSMPSSSTIVVS